MAYIYKITNDINGKIYIGKTEKTIQQRFKEHCRDSKKEVNKNRPLYRAMNKYGIEHFYVEQIEETDVPEMRETYWIEFYGSFKNGYNATMGGDGKKYLDYDLVVSTYRELLNAKEVSRSLNIDHHHVLSILKARGEHILSSAEISKRKNSKITNMYDLDGTFLQSFPSTRAAADYMVKNNLTNCKLSTIRQHIAEVCTGRRKTAAKFKWSYAD